MSRMCLFFVVHRSPFPCGPIGVCSGGVAITYPMHLNDHKWEILVGFHVLTAIGGGHDMQFVEFVSFIQYVKIACPLQDIERL